jgi:hypothetical protein
MFLQIGFAISQLRGARVWMAAGLVLALTGAAAAQAPATPAPRTTDPAPRPATPEDYKPTVGMPGKTRCGCPRARR